MVNISYTRDLLTLTQSIFLSARNADVMNTYGISLAAFQSKNTFRIPTRIKDISLTALAVIARIKFSKIFRYLGAWPSYTH